MIIGNPFFCGLSLVYPFNAFTATMQSIGLKATHASEIWRLLSKTAKDEWAERSTLLTRLWRCLLSCPYSIFYDAVEYVRFLIPPHIWAIELGVCKGEKENNPISAFRRYKSLREV